ncbi:hypothetical protein SLEP1_g30131 [Rubroshorea leprosula]|uniref:Uncharacterized protein n=1 Tax=Rubroshorea leprosula TaxID=152421 RepID=A0AAV5K9A4_9ROSI|nr:hypothetical protein SLEP1_g30131 [Rubroshorea leprosula]
MVAESPSEGCCVHKVSNSRPCLSWNILSILLGGLFSLSLLLPFARLWTRKEKEIAIVSHVVFLQDTVMAVGPKSNLPTKTDLFKRFQNCELRSVIIAGESLMSLDSLANGKNSGRIQCSLELPNAAAKETVTEKEH